MINGPKGPSAGDIYNDAAKIEFELGIVSVLQGEIYVSSMACLGKNTANIWIHQDMEDDTGEGLTNLDLWICGTRMESYLNCNAD